MRNILLSGYYGFNNTGDEAILASTVNALRNARPYLNIMVLSKRPGETGETYGVESYPRMNLPQVVKAIKKADLVVFGGGSLLQDATSLRSLIYYLSVIELSHMLNKPVLIYANGIGPINSQIGRMLTKHTLSHVQAITVRDSESREELRQIGISKQVQVTADPAFLLNPSPNEVVDSILEDHGINHSSKIVWVALRRINAPTWFQRQLVDLIAWLREENFEPCFFAMQERDLKIAENLNQKLRSVNQKPMGMISNISPEDALGILGKGEFCLGMRLHTLILSARVQVPFMGIEIDPKIGAFCRTADCPVLPHPAKTPNFDLKSEFGNLIKNKMQLITLLGQKLPDFHSLARENINIVLSHLN